MLRSLSTLKKHSTKSLSIRSLSSSEKEKDIKVISRWASINFPDFIEHWSRDAFYKTGGAITVLASLMSYEYGFCQETVVINSIVGLYWVVGYRDMKQRSHAILRNFPVLGNFRYFAEMIRPEIRQYLIESDEDGKPFDRQHRAIAYQRAKNASDTLPFGTRRDVYTPGYEWANHSMFPKIADLANSRVMIGGKDCKQPYSASLLNISAMSYGALSDNAILALSSGAKRGNFYHNTGEGGVSRFHLEGGGDIVWNIGTGYFGCRNSDGSFSPTKFQQQALNPQIKMIEIKLSQGAKPGHGGLLPAAKVTPFIAEARGISMGVDCHSPPSHSAFNDARGLVQFITKLRDLSGGKPIGFKLCVGKNREFAAIVQAMIELDTYPDFITVDGGEGGTGAAPPEFSNTVGMPLVEGLTFVNNILIGANVRQHIKIICSGKVLSGFSIVRNLALGADLCNAARAMMFALGCIQALKCNTNRCPTGITTQNKELMEGLHVDSKSVRVANYQKKTVEYAMDIIAAIGCDYPHEVKAEHIMKRPASNKSQSLAELYPTPAPGSLLDRTAPQHLLTIWDKGIELNKLNRIKSTTAKTI